MLEEAWSELFLLNAIQWCMPLDGGVTGAVSSCPLFSPAEHAKSHSHAAAAAAHDVRQLADTLQRFRHVHVDPAEFACLKAIVLFRAGRQIHPSVPLTLLLGAGLLLSRVGLKNWPIRQGYLAIETKSLDLQ